MSVSLNVSVSAGVRMSESDHLNERVTCTDPAAAAAAAVVTIGAPTAVALCFFGRVCPALSRALTICGQGHVLQGLQVRVRCEV